MAASGSGMVLLVVILVCDEGWYGIDGIGLWLWVMLLLQISCQGRDGNSLYCDEDGISATDAVSMGFCTFRGVDVIVMREGYKVIIVGYVLSLSA